MASLDSSGRLTGGARLPPDDDDEQEVVNLYVSAEAGSAKGYLEAADSAAAAASDHLANDG